MVANEVKTLASTTSSSTGDIGRTIATIEGDTRAVAAAIAAVTERLAAIQATTAEISAATGRQRDTAAELAGEVDQATSRVRTMTMA